MHTVAIEAGRNDGGWLRVLSGEECVRTHARSSALRDGDPASLKQGDSSCVAMARRDGIAIAPLEEIRARRLGQHWAWCTEG